ncbi:hypothetical protein [Phytohabitans houttuyneae]|uniref:Mycothiol-dependent maleylpyruvate isomerase metal-binding domain-containing protein n=1 Tax=Phytohabitans houttuyneae TaxID=1076126 RepID=A0A6V8JW40_9ACTN|nr:hypothetical protein [Phytohabitans houttuyneae]GFJ76863.1 hypothetical protein Phou_010430 [Phytohabitans houttuyneae]
MAMTVSDEQWWAARGALKAAGDRFADLVARAPYPDRAMATADWSVAVTAAHVSSIAWLYTSLLDTGAPPASIPGFDGQIRSTTVDTVDALNEMTLAHYTERDIRRVAERLRTDVDYLLRVSEQRDPSEPFSWLGGAQVPLAGLFAHLVNELLIHGFDVARTVGLPWEVPSRDAGLFFDLLLVGVARNGYGRLLDGGGPPRERRIAIEFRSRYTVPVTLVLHRGLVTAQEPGGPVDARVTFDPAVLNLMLFGRVSRVRAALSGKISVRGRRPWVLPVFLRTVRVPDTARTQSLASRT